MHQTHENHPHKHSTDCGHTRIRHHDHVDYVHDGHLHKEHENHFDECQIEVSERNPDTCKPVSCGCNHTEDCGHERVPHGDHVDFLVGGRLHHVHGDHCDDHGPVDVVQ